MAFKNSLKIQMKKAFSSFAGRRLTSGPRPKPAQPASRSAVRLASPRPSPALRWPTSARLPTDAPRRAPDRGRACPPRGGHAPSTPPRVAAGLRPRPRARLHLLEPVRSLTPSRAAFPLRQSREPQALPLAAPRTRRRNSPRLLHLGRQSRARSSASPSFKLCSRLRHLPSSGRAASASPPTAMVPPCSAAMEVTFPLFSSPA